MERHTTVMVTVIMMVLLSACLVASCVGASEKNAAKMEAVRREAEAKAEQLKAIQRARARQPLQFRNDATGGSLATEINLATENNLPTKSTQARFNLKNLHAPRRPHVSRMLAKPQWRPVPLDEALVEKIYAVARENDAEFGALVARAADASVSKRVFDGTRIPRRVVTTYFSESVGDLIPEVRAALASWQDDELVPGVELVYYGDSAARAFLVDHYPHEIVKAWDTLVPGAFKADLFRYCEILKNGGLYVDVKCTRRISLKDMVGKEGTIAVDGRDVGAWNGLFAAPPGAPWVAASLVRTLENIFSKKTSPCLDITGPGVLGRSVREWVGETADTTSCAFLRAQPELLEARRIRVLVMEIRKNNHFVAATVTPRKRVAMSTYNEAYRKQRAKSPVTEYNLACTSGTVYVSSA